MNNKNFIDLIKDKLGTCFLLTDPFLTFNFCEEIVLLNVFVDFNLEKRKKLINCISQFYIRDKYKLSKRTLFLEAKFI